MALERISYPTEWYATLISDCKAIMTRAKIEVGTQLLRAKWELGNRVIKDYERFGRSEHGNKTQRDLALALGTTQQNVSGWIRFREEVGDDFESWIESTDASVLSWRKVVHGLLPLRGRGPVVSPPFPEGEFDIIYADPPWRYDVKLRGTPEDHYPTMSFEEICNLKIPALEDSVLFLWATNPMLEDALKVMESWGFKYKTNMVWIKDKLGVGFWFRGQHELLLVGVKGDVHPPVESNRLPSVLFAPVEAHSKKPEKVYDIIEDMYPSHRYLELFARERREGWEAWGNEV